MGYSAWGHKELDTTWQLSTHGISLLFGLPGGSVVKNLPANEGDVGSVPESRRSPGEENVSPLQYSRLEFPWTEEPGGLQSLGSQESDTTQRLTTATTLFSTSPHVRECSHPHHRSPLILYLHHKTDTERNRED